MLCKNIVLTPIIIYVATLANLLFFCHFFKSLEDSNSKFIRRIFLTARTDYYRLEDVNEFNQVFQ